MYLQTAETVNVSVSNGKRQRSSNSDDKAAEGRSFRSPRRQQ